MRFRRFSEYLTFLFHHPSSFRLPAALRGGASRLGLFEGLAGAEPAPGVFEPAARGAFRVLGLHAAAPQGEVFDAASSVRLALKLGVRKTFESDAAWLFGPAPREESDVRDAVGRLSEPAARAGERLFWFHAHPAHAHASNVSELARALDALLARVPLHADGAPGGKGAGGAGGAEGAGDNRGDSDASDGPRLAEGRAAALHDAALLALCGAVRFDPAVRDVAAWARAFELWRRVFACEEFWSLLVAADLKGDYEQPVTFGEVDELRRAAPRVVAAHAAARAGEAARDGRLREAARALHLLRGAGLPAALLQEYENEVVGPAEDATIEELDRAFAWVDGLGFTPKNDATRRNYCNEAWHRFEALTPRLAEFAGLAGADSHPARRVFEHAATKLLRLAVAFEGAGRPHEALYVCGKAHALAPPGSDELAAVESKLSALGAGAVPRERDPGDYAAALAGELAAARPPAKLFKDDPKGDRTVGSFSNKSDAPGCVTSLAFWLVMVAACFGLQRCGVINLRSTRTPIDSFPPAIMRPNLNYNLNFNYNIPPPLNLRPYADPQPKGTKRPGGKSRRQPRGAPAPPPPSAVRAPNVNAPPPR